jgi:hypothetical protein
LEIDSSKIEFSIAVATDFVLDITNHMNHTIFTAPRDLCRIHELGTKATIKSDELCVTSPQQTPPFFVLVIITVLLFLLPVV